MAGILDFYGYDSGTNDMVSQKQQLLSNQAKIDGVQNEKIEELESRTCSGTVISVNGKIGNVILDADDIGAATAEQGMKADTAYQKPSNGIPTSDLDSGVQSSLSKADTAYQKPSNGIPKADLASGVQTSLGKADTAIQEVKTINGNSIVGTGDINITSQTYVIDNTPTYDSNNLVTSGGVQKELALGAVWDVSEHNSLCGTTFESLSVILNSPNLDVLIPTDVRKGGMTIKFVQTSDNNYVQFRYMSSSTTNANFTNVANWQGVDAEPTLGSKSLIESGGVASLFNNKIEPQLSWTSAKRVDASATSATKIINAGASFSITDYIEIVRGVTAKAYGIQGYKNVSTYPINFYDASKNWIGCSGDVTGDYDFTNIIPSNAVYVVISQYTDNYPTSGVKIVFESEGIIPTKEETRSIVQEYTEPIEDEIDVLSESSTKVMITQDDIDSTVSNPNFIVENGTVKSGSAISKSGSTFMLFKPDITAIEFTIGDLWDGNRFELCFGCGYYNEARVNAGATLIAPNDYFVLFSVGTGDAEAGTILAQDARENPITVVSTGDRCMVEIVLDKYILGWVWDDVNNRWKYWFMLNPTDPWSLCNPVHTRLRYGWNERIGIGLSVIYNSAAAGLEMMKDVNILSRKGTNLEIYHNAVRIGRRFMNKKWLAIGDSITAYDELNGWGYVGYTSRRNMLDAINCGNSGWGVCGVLQKHAGFAPYEEIKVDWEDAVAELGVNDVVSIFLGTNDFYSVGRTDIDTVEPYRYPITLGATDPTDADAKNPRTVLGAFRLLIERLQDANPSVKIIILAPFLRTDSDYPVNTIGMTMREFSDAICNVAKEYGLEHYNLCDYAGINAISIESLTNDGLHPNQKGGERLGEIMARWIY